MAKEQPQNSLSRGLDRPSVHASIYRDKLLVVMPTPRPLTSEEKELHFRFLRFEIPWAELFRDRHGVLEFNFTLNAGNFVANFLTPDPGVPVTLSDIDFAIAKYKIGEISKDGLASWATLLLLNDAFDWQGPDEDEVARRLNHLSMPQLFRKE